MDNKSALKYKNIRPHIADAIKQSCYKIDARLYNIANEVHKIPTFSVEPGVEIAEGLNKIVDKTIKSAVDLDCDLAVVTKGILQGAFRSTPFMAQEAHKTIHILIDELLRAVMRHKGHMKPAIEGIFVGIVDIAKEFNLNVPEAVKVARENILRTAEAVGPSFAESVQQAIPNLNDFS